MQNPPPPMPCHLHPHRSGTFVSSILNVEMEYWQRASLLINLDVHQTRQGTNWTRPSLRVLSQCSYLRF